MTTSSIRWRSAAIRSWAWPGCSMPIAPAMSRWPMRSAPAWPTTRRSMPTCRTSSGITWAKSRSCNNVETYLCRERRSGSMCWQNLDKLVVKAVGESGGYGMLIGPQSHRGGARGVRREDQGRSAQLHRAADDLAFARALLDRRRARAAACRSAALHPVRRQGDDCARRPDARGAEARARWW